MNVISRALGALVLSVAASALAQAAPTTLKVVLDGEVQVIDPIASAAYATRAFAYMVFDTLFSVDKAGAVHPQMVDNYTVSGDGLTYTFHLRDGLKFSDGKAVTADDCVASIERWAKRDGFGKQLIASVKTMQARDDKTFTIELAKPFGFVIDALGKASSNVPVIMPARIARGADPTKAVTEIVGSGPFLFKRDEWVPGAKMVFLKNPDYKPRNEPADGLSGGKVARVDRVEFITMPDPATKVAALQSGEVDYVQNLPFDFLPTLQANKQVTIEVAPGLGSLQSVAFLNHLQPPFNNLKVRQAAQAALVQTDIMSALGAPDSMYMQCESMFLCDAPYSSTAGADIFKNTGTEKARALLKASGYKGEKVVVLHSTDVYAIHMAASVMEDQLRQAGFNVEVQAMDWQLIAQRRSSKAPVEKGGWSVMPGHWVGFDQGSPTTNFGTAYNCVDGYAGWYCDEEVNKLLADFLTQTDLQKRRALADRIQLKAFENVNVILGGQFSLPQGYRANIKGVQTVGIPVFWNIEKQ